MDGGRAPAGPDRFRQRLQHQPVKASRRRATSGPATG